MRAEFARHALDRVPLSLAIEDSTALVNLNYFLLRDRGRPGDEHMRSEDMPVVHPEAFAREVAQWCAEHGVKGKFSIVPCPAALGRIDQGLPLFGQTQIDSWLAMAREHLAPVFDITPELMTHTWLVDPETCKPLGDGRWEPHDCAVLAESDLEWYTDYLSAACRILDNVGLPPEGLCAPGGFGGQSIDRLARITGDGIRSVTGHPTPYFIKRFTGEGPVDTPVWYGDRGSATAVGEIQVCTVAWTGSWTGYGDVDTDKHITADLRGGRLPAVINAGDPAVISSHWQAFYGMHDDDRHGFESFKTVVQRLEQFDPQGERTRWRKCSEIASYACGCSLGEITVDGTLINLDLPLPVAELTLRLSDVSTTGISVNDVPLTAVGRKADFENGSYFVTENETYVAFDAASGTTIVNAKTA